MIVIQLVVSAHIDSWGIFSGTLIAGFALLFCNFAMAICYWRVVSKDLHFKHWAAKHKC